MYSKEIRERVKFLYSQGMSAARIEAELGISQNTVYRWCTSERPHPMSNSRYPVRVIREALHLAYGPDGIGLKSAAERLGLNHNTIAMWKWKYTTEATVDDEPRLPDITPAPPSPVPMTEEEKDRRIHELELRNAVLEEELKLLKAEGVSVRSSSDKARIVDALADRYHKTELFAVVGITSATYYRQVAIRDRIDKYAQVREELKEAFHSSNGTYGYRRVHAMLVRGGRRISEKVVMRLMREEGCIVAKRLQGRSWSSYAGESSPAPPNIMARDFHAQAPNMRWVTDITEMRAADGKVYLSPVVDCFDGMVVAYTIGRSPTAELANGMLRRALSTLRQGALPPMIHSDRGGHYRWPEWVRICEGAGVVRSMSKKGCSPDNAACEGFFGTFKSEAYYPRGWSKMTADELMAATGDYIDWYNGSRIKESLGWKSPAEYREEQGMMPNFY
ncbi:MAG: IS3 family transposase [Coriobacteriales bacterium]|nr:IS3 family transposase [Coriobacteriales bacterium]